MDWPRTADGLIALQLELGASQQAAWAPPAETVGGVFVCFGTGGSGPGTAGDTGWAGAALMAGERLVAAADVAGAAGAGYAAGLLAMREGPLLEAAVRELPDLPDVLLVDATGRDHPRRAGLALHLGAVLGMPTVGVTHRPLLATGGWPKPERGATSPLLVDGAVVGHWLRTRAGVRPLAVHAAWRTDPDVAVAVVRAAVGRVRTPEPLRMARRAARRARARSEDRSRLNGRRPSPAGRRTP